MQVTGVVRIPGRGAPFTVAALRVAVRDVGEADGAATVLAAAVVPDVAVPGDGAEVPFALDVPDVRVRGAVPASVRVHADVSGSGDVAVGDLVSTSAHPVRPGGDSARVVVPLEPVRA